MSAQVLINIDAQDRMSGHPTVRHFVTTDEAVAFAQIAVACNCHGDVVAVFGDDGEEVDPSVYGSQAETKRPAASASKADWVAYAESIGFDPTDLTRDQIIAQTEET